MLAKIYLKKNSKEMFWDSLNILSTKLRKFLYEKYGDLFQSNGSVFRIKNIEATFSAMSLGNDESYYDIQIESSPPGKYRYTAIIKFEDFINLIDKLEKLSIENWPINQ